MFETEFKNKIKWRIEKKMGKFKYYIQSNFYCQ